MPSLPATDEQERAAKAWVEDINRHTGMDCRYPDDKDVTLNVMQGARIPSFVIVAWVRRAVCAVTRENERGEWMQVGGKTKIRSGEVGILGGNVQAPTEPVKYS